MFHAGGHKGVNTRGRSSGLSRHYPNFFSHPDWKAPLRCGILFCTFSCVLFVIGVILTWLGTRRSVHDVFGESVPITGPILLAVGGLMLLLALRQFYMAHTRKKAHAKAAASKEPGETTIAPINENDEDDVLSSVHCDLLKNKEDGGDLDDNYAAIDGTEEKPPLLSRGYYDGGTVTSTLGEPQGYVWPPVSQSPYYSMAMMVYKDPSLTYGPYVPPSYVSSSGSTLAYSTSPVVASGSDAIERGDQEPSSEAAASAGIPSPVEPANLAVLETSSTTLHQPTNVASTSPIQITHETASKPEPPKIFPADYLKTHQRNSGPSNVANASAGISNLPNPTAFMMIRTLELQETI